MRLSSTLSTLGLLSITHGYPSGHNVSRPNHHPGTIAHELFSRVRIGQGDGTTGPGGQGIADLFLLHDGPSSCRGHLETLDAWLKEIRELHKIVEEVYALGLLHPVPFSFFMTYFGVEFKMSAGQMELKDDMDEQLWRQIGDNISRVSRFLNGRGLTNPQLPGENPRLFCGPDAFEYQDWGQIAKDENGDRMVKGRDPATNEPTEYVPLPEVFRNEQERGDTAFWVDTFNGYEFSQRLSVTICPPIEDDRVLNGRTSRPAKRSGASEKEKYKVGRNNRHVILCPPAFAPGDWHKEVHKFPSLDMAIQGEYPTPGRDDFSDEKFILSRRLTLSTTLYHELYHLVDDGRTNDYNYQLNEIIQGAVEKPSLAWLGNNAENPETYMYLAMALYYFAHLPDNDASRRIAYRGARPLMQQEYLAKFGFPPFLLFNDPIPMS